MDASDAGLTRGMGAELAGGVPARASKGSKARRSARLGGRMPSSAWRWIAMRALATAGAASFAIGAWAPWLAFTLGLGPGNTGVQTQVAGNAGLSLFFQLAGLSLPLVVRYVLAFTWGAVTVLGLLLCPVYWQRLSVRIAHLALTANLVWLVLATVAATVAANAMAWLALQPHAELGVTVAAWQIGWGFWLAAVGLLASWSAAALLRAEARRRVDVRYLMSGKATPRPLMQVVGASLVSLGALVWGLGFLALPWATVNCVSVTLTFTHFTHGACAGLDAGDALASAMAGRYNASQVAATPTDISLLAYGLLAGGALLLIAASWRRAMTRSLAVWLTLWLGLALGTALVAVRGVGVILRTSPVLSTASAGRWENGPGLAVCFVGLLLVAAGLVPLWRRALGAHVGMKDGR